MSILSHKGLAQSFREVEFLFKTRHSIIIFNLAFNFWIWTKTFSQNFFNCPKLDLDESEVFSSMLLKDLFNKLFLQNFSIGQTSELRISALQSSRALSELIIWALPSSWELSELRISALPTLRALLELMIWALPSLTALSGYILA